MMQIYKSLLVKCQIIMQIYFKSRLGKCHNKMQIRICWSSAIFCDADIFVLSVSSMIQIYFLSVGKVP